MRASLFAAALLLASAPLALADPQSELAAFSVFPQIDAKELLKGDALVMRGPAMSSARDLSVQSCFVAPGTPVKILAALRDADPAAHDPKIFLHGDVSLPPSPANFEKLRSAPSNSAVQTLVNDTEKGSNTLQISRAEAKKLPTAASSDATMPEPVSSFWIGLLTGRAQAFASGGIAGQAAYDFSDGGARPGESVGELMRQQGSIKRQFSSFLGEAGVTGGKPSIKTDGYYELVRVEDDGVLSLGSFASRAVGAGFQAADTLYYASGGYDVAMTLYQMWPIDAGGQPATLVWRGDLISSSMLASLHGIEKLGAESAMLKDVTKSVEVFKRDIGAAR